MEYCSGGVLDEPNSESTKLPQVTAERVFFVLNLGRSCKIDDGASALTVAY